jgi:acetyl-CoA acetyltransferase
MGSGLDRAWHERRDSNLSEGRWLRDKAAIVGFGHSPYGKRGQFSERGTTPLVIEAVIQACEDAGVSPSDIDGYTSYSHDAVDPGNLAAGFGAERLRFTAMGWGGGGGAMGGAYLYAAMAVATGQADLVAVVRGISQPPTARFGGMGRGAVPRYPEALTPAQTFAMQARRHMHEFGTTIDHFGEVAVSTRAYASNNPDARFRDPITMEDHANSRLIADPIRLLDCCMESDGGCCVLITTTERAQDLRQTPVLLSGVAMGAPRRWGYGAFGGFNMADTDYVSAGQRTIAEDLYRNAGMGPSDVDVAMIYDHFSPMVLMGLEDFGFVPQGESGPFVAEGNLRPGGKLPTNTHGGNLSEIYLHGMTHVFEGVRQCRGTSANQQPDVDTSLVVCGSSPAPSGALLLRRRS